MIRKLKKISSKINVHSKKRLSIINIPNYKGSKNFLSLLQKYGFIEHYSINTKNHNELFVHFKPLTFQIQIHTNYPVKKFELISLTKKKTYNGFFN